jgi:hypothetical protein
MIHKMVWENFQRKVFELGDDASPMEVLSMILSSLRNDIRPLLFKKPFSDW